MLLGLGRGHEVTRDVPVTTRSDVAADHDRHVWRLVADLLEQRDRRPVDGVEARGVVAETRTPATVGPPRRRLQHDAHPGPASDVDVRQEVLGEGRSARLVVHQWEGREVWEVEPAVEEEGRLQSAVGEQQVAALRQVISVAARTHRVTSVSASGSGHRTTDPVGQPRRTSTDGEWWTRGVPSGEGSPEPPAFRTARRQAGWLRSNSASSSATRAAAASLNSTPGCRSLVRWSTQWVRHVRDGDLARGGGIGHPDVSAVHRGFPGGAVDAVVLGTGSSTERTVAQR